tara:strand:- start:297 stop:476 length:180 start_codon:yes stop_codon:yes gene_type:complete
MDKETLIKLAQPAATFALAISLVSIPLMTRAQINSYLIESRYGPLLKSGLRVYHMNSCN